MSAQKILATGGTWCNIKRKNHEVGYNTIDGVGYCRNCFNAYVKANDLVLVSQDDLDAAQAATEQAEDELSLAIEVEWDE